MPPGWLVKEKTMEFIHLRILTLFKDLLKPNDDCLNEGGACPKDKTGWGEGKVFSCIYDYCYCDGCERISNDNCALYDFCKLSDMSFCSLPAIVHDSCLKYDKY